MRGVVKIASLTLWKAPLTSHETYNMASGRSCATEESVVLRVGTKMGIERTWRSDIVTAAALHLAASSPQDIVQKVCHLSGHVSPRQDPGAPSRLDGRISVSDAIGLGVEADIAILGQPIAVID